MNYCTIDHNIRKIRVPISEKILGVVGDKDIKRRYFKVPRYYEGNDLSKFDIKINYVNEDCDKNMYVVDDVQTEDDYITFSWLIEAGVCRVPGDVGYVVCMRLVDEDGNVVKEYNTELTIGTVLDGCEADSTEVEEETKDIVAQFMRYLDDVKGDVVNVKNAAETAATAATTATDKANEASTYASDAKSSSGSAKENADLVSANKIEIDNMKSDVESKVEQFESDLETYSVRTLRSDMTELQKETSDGFSELKSDLVDLEKSNFIKVSLFGNANAVNWHLKKVDYKIGDVIKFIVHGSSVRCNILAITDDGENIILVNSAVAGKEYNIEITSNIVEIGLYIYDYGIGIVYIAGDAIGDAITSIKSITSDINRKLDTVVYEKVSGFKMFTNSNTEYINGKLFRENIHRDYPSGNSARAITYGANKAKISGFGWDSSYGYFLYGLFDINGKPISKVVKDNSYETDLEIDIPSNTYEIRVNGNSEHLADIKLFTYETNFEKCYENLSSQKDRKLKFLTLGDSITMLGTGERGWIRYFIEKTGYELVANVAMNSAVLFDYADTVYDGNPQQSNQTNNVLGNQVQKIINNNYEAPDIIIIAVGTNGGISITADEIKNAYYGNDGVLIPLENVDRRTHAGAYRYAIETLHNMYPNAIIFYSTPIHAVNSIRRASDVVKWMESVKVATDYSGQIMIDTIHCGINGVNEKSGENGEYLIDGLHPNVNGAKKIGYYIASKVVSILETMID